MLGCEWANMERMNAWEKGKRRACMGSARLSCILPNSKRPGKLVEWGVVLCGIVRVRVSRSEGGPYHQRRGGSAGCPRLHPRGCIDIGEMSVQQGLVCDGHGAVYRVSLNVHVQHHLWCACGVSIHVRVVFFLSIWSHVVSLWVTE